MTRNEIRENHRPYRTRAHWRAATAAGRPRTQAPRSRSLRSRSTTTRSRLRCKRARPRRRSRPAPMFAASIVENMVPAPATAGHEEITTAADVGRSPEAERRYHQRVGDNRARWRLTAGARVRCRALAPTPLRRASALATARTMGFAHGFRRESADDGQIGFASPAPGRERKPVSPSPTVCEGLSACEAISAITATRLACALVSRAFVATTPMVVFSPGFDCGASAPSRVISGHRPACRQGCALQRRPVPTLDR